MSDHADYADEIESLHAFFEDWYHGRVTADAANFERVRAALADGFEMVTPDGEVHDRATVLSGIESQHGARRGTDPGFRIEISGVSTIDVSGERALCRYIEHQRVDGVWEARVSSVLFGSSRGPANGIEWRHVHETWLPEPEAHPKGY